MPNGAQHAVLFVGLGDGADLSLEAIREMTGHAVAAARRLGAKVLTIKVPTFDNDVAAVVEGMVVAAHLADYAFDTYKKANGAKRLKDFTLVLENGRDLLKARKAVERGNAIASGVSIARDLVNMPAHVMTPSALAEAAERIAKEGGRTMKLKVLDKDACEKLGMGAYLAVSLGADNPPKFIHLSYKPERPTKKRLVVVGKGVTFDSGGLSLKPADAMMTMKCDMAGAAAVLGFFSALAQLRPRVEVHGIVAATENMPSGKAIRPGDVVKASNGKTIEILNTDAEGRLTLADALTYAKKLEPTAMVDLATLTGACVVALGEEITGLMSNNDDLAGAILSAAGRAGEKMWRMPLEKRYRSLVESDIADLRNIATTRYGGSLTAGLFLEEFVDGLPWAHLDIAGPAFAEKPMASYIGKGGTGHGVRTLVELVEGM
ncbi:MAG: leucyl aminopeptidase [Patescibacteria group bacterium]